MKKKSRFFNHPFSGARDTCSLDDGDSDDRDRVQ